MTKLLRHNGTIGWIGITATIAYAAAMFWFVDGRWSDLQKLELNELGDFLAGAFGPLAILWLVLGFFQQGLELRQNRLALHIQAEELRNSVRQQTLMASAAQDQLQTSRDALAKQTEIERQREMTRILQAQPVFRLNSISYGGISSKLNRHRIEIKNLGSECGDVEITTKSMFISTPIRKKFTHIGRMQVKTIELDIDKDYSGNTELQILYIDALGTNQQQIFLAETRGNEVIFHPPENTPEFNRQISTNTPSVDKNQ